MVIQMRLIDADVLETHEQLEPMGNGEYEYVEVVYKDDIDDAPTVSGWIPVSEKLPKENEYVDNVCKYYLIQDEYGDMHVAHLSSRGWETIESVKALGDDVVAWMPLPEPYKGGDDE